MDKKELRTMIRQRKRQLSQSQLGELSLPVVRRCLEHPMVKAADVIMLYHSLSDEVQTGELIEGCIAMGKTVLLPRVISDTEMDICIYRSTADLRVSSYGIMEPCGEPFSDTDRITVAIIPGMAFTEDGCRLGRGKGYYDRFLSVHPDIHKIGICFPFQILDHIPTESTDILMDEVISS